MPKYGADSNKVFCWRAFRWRLLSADVGNEAAPVHFARAETAPIMVLYADNDLPAREEENAYFVALMKDGKNKHIDGLEIQDRNHNTIASEIKNPDDPARKAMLAWMLGKDPR